MTSHTLQTVLFDDDPNPGYILVKYLTAGSSGLVCIVRSLSTGRFYVRKQVDCVPDLVPEEVSIAPVLQRSDHVARLLHTNKCVREVSKNGSAIDVHTMYFEYCNGGSLSLILQRFFDIATPIPELLIWHVFSSVAKILAGLHLGWTESNPLKADFVEGDRPAIAHRDVKSDNVFLHWPDENAILPEIRLGDLGQAKAQSPCSALDFSNLAEIDIGHLGEMLIEMIYSFNPYATDEDPEQPGTWQSCFPKEYSDDLFRICSALNPEPGKKRVTSWQLASEFMPLVDNFIAQSLVRLPAYPRASTIVRWTRPSSQGVPLLFGDLSCATGDSALFPLSQSKGHWHFQSIAVPQETWQQTIRGEWRHLQQRICEGHILPKEPTPDYWTPCSRRKGPQLES